MGFFPGYVFGSQSPPGYEEIPVYQTEQLMA